MPATTTGMHWKWRKNTPVEKQKEMLKTDREKKEAHLLVMMDVEYASEIL